MPPSPNLDMVIFTLKETEFKGQDFDLNDVDDHLNSVSKDKLGFSSLVTHEIKVELNDLLAAYGYEQNANSIWDRSAPDYKMYLQTDKTSAMPVTHFVNPGDKEFTKGAFSIELPAGNFSVAYGVYADHEQEALDYLADYETERLKHNPEIAIFKVNEKDYTPEELEAMEDAGEITRLGNEGSLFDVSTISVRSASLLSLESDIDIDCWLEEKNRLFKKPESPSPSM